MRRVIGVVVALVIAGAAAGVAVALTASASPSHHRPPGNHGRGRGHHQVAQQPKRWTPPNPGQQTTTVSYGPYTVPASTVAMDAMPKDEIDMTGMGMLENHIAFNVAKPCTNCYLTSMTPNLVYPDGRTANVDSGAWLHHTVLFDRGPGKVDATCPPTSSGLGHFLGRLGDRFFASGNERTEFAVPSSYGYYVGPTDRFNQIVDLMNENMTPLTVTIQIKYTWVPASPQMHPVRPIWLDENECGNSEITVPAGHSSTPWSWTSNVSGKVLAIGGHIHDYGINIYAQDDTTHKQICNSVALYGTTPEYIDMMGMKHISQMTGCLAPNVHRPIATIRAGDTISIHAQYNPPEKDAGVMGIMVAYVAES